MVAPSAQTPVYMSSPTTGTDVNVGRGAVQTEVRGVFISSIDYNAKSEDILRHFGRAGRIVKCQLLKDPVTNKSKGNATVQYSNAKDAKKAVNMFNNEKWMSMRLKVRLDRDYVAVCAPTPSTSRSSATASSSRSVQQGRISAEPIIVNGSMR